FSRVADVARGPTDAAVRESVRRTRDAGPGARLGDVADAVALPAGRAGIPCGMDAYAADDLARVAAVDRTRVVVVALGGRIGGGAFRRNDAVERVRVRL